MMMVFCFLLFDFDSLPAYYLCLPFSPLIHTFPTITPFPVGTILIPTYCILLLNIVPLPFRPATFLPHASSFSTGSFLWRCAWVLWFWNALVPATPTPGRVDACLQGLPALIVLPATLPAILPHNHLYLPPLLPAYLPLLPLF